MATFVASRPSRMASPTHRSLRHEYELYVEQEIEAYKESVPRHVLLGIGDEAVGVLAAQQQLALTELVLCEEVDRIISRRLRLPTYETWKRRRLRLLAKYKTPAHWGIAPDAPLVREIRASPATRVLVAGADAEAAALYLAANGCEVVAVEPEEDAVERVMHAATAVGLTERVRGWVAGLDEFAPDALLHAVVCTPAAFDGLSAAERHRAIVTLQSATVDGGVHLVQTIVAGQTIMSLDELRHRYDGWQVAIAPEPGTSQTFLARKRLS